MNAKSRQAQACAVKVLLYYTLLYTESDIICGHCGESAAPLKSEFCTTCAVTWRFAAITFKVSLGMKAQAEIFKESLPRALTFIGRADAAGVHEPYLPLIFD